MNRLTKNLMLALIAGLTTQLAVAAANVATVNGKAIPQAYADALLALQKAKGAPDSNQLRGEVREALVKREILLQAAAKSGIDKKAEVARCGVTRSQAPSWRSWTRIRRSSSAMETVERSPSSESTTSRATA